MRIVLELQGHQELYLERQGAIYGLNVSAGSRGGYQLFTLEGSVETLRVFFEAGCALVDECIEKGRRTEDLPVAAIGSPAE